MRILFMADLLWINVGSDNIYLVHIMLHNVVDVNIDFATRLFSRCFHVAAVNTAG